MASCFDSSPSLTSCNVTYFGVRALAHQTLSKYCQLLYHLEARCLRPLLRCVGSVAIASTILSPATIVQALPVQISPEQASPEQESNPPMLSFELQQGGEQGGEFHPIARAGETSLDKDVYSRGDREWNTTAMDYRAVSTAEGSVTVISGQIPGRIHPPADSFAQPTDSIHAASAQEKSQHQGGTLTLALPEPVLEPVLEPALVAAAPLALSQSVQRSLQPSVQHMGQAVIPKSHPSTDSLPDNTPEKAPNRDLDQPFAIPEDWWHQGEKSPIAVAIGAAEGTRHADGGKTAAYYWHRDPGNGADNFGTFSYQHLSHSLTHPIQRQDSTAAKREAAAQNQLPEIADRAQMKRLRRFHDQLQQQATAKGLIMGQLEILNALDLANQSEAAALWHEGYVDRLAQLQDYDYSPEEKVLQARSWSYWSPGKKRWDAPGLGNTYERIRRDQQRRMEAIQQAIEQYAPPKTIAQTSAQTKTPAQANTIAQAEPITEASLAEQIILFDLL